MIRTHGTTHYDPNGCFGCKLSTLNYVPNTMQPHFNWAVGQYVNNDREYRDALKQCEERNSLATGTDHHYEARDPRDLQPIRSADQAVDDHFKAASDKAQGVLTNG